MADKKESTLRCVGTLAVIAVVCALLLSVLNSLLYVAPTAEDIAKNYDKLSGYNWVVKDLSDNKYGEGGRVTLVAEGTKEGEDTYIGMLVQTDKSGKLNESVYAMYFNKSTDTLEYATYASMGSTGGFDWAYAKAHAGDGEATTGATALTALLTDDSSTSEAEWRDWESFYVKITSETVNDHNGEIPAKTGATRTVTATYHAFDIAARYYYDNFVKGVNA